MNNTELELKDINIEWIAGGATLTSFKIKVKNLEKPYTIVANNLHGEVSIQEDKQ